MPPPPRRFTQLEPWSSTTTKVYPTGTLVLHHHEGLPNWNLGPPPPRRFTQLEPRSRPGQRIGKTSSPNASGHAASSAKGAHRELSLNLWRWHETSNHRPGRRRTARRECVDDGRPGPRSGQLAGVDLAWGAGRDGGRLRKRRGVAEELQTRHAHRPAEPAGRYLRPQGGQSR